MSGYDMTSEITAVMAATGLDIAGLNRRLGYSSGAVTEDGGRYYAASRRVESAVYNLFYAIPAPTAPAPAAQAAAPLASERQVSYIMSLIHRGAHHEGGFFSGPTTLAGVQSLTRSEASTYIDSLTGRY